MSKLNISIIVNPVSGGGGDDRVNRLTNIAKAHGWKGKPFVTTKKQDAGFFTKKAIRGGSTHIIICGGDGSIMEAVSAAIDKPVRFGIVPLGTGNLFAQNLGIPLDMEDAMRIAFTGQPIAIDVGKANETFFTVMAGIGFDAAMMRDAKRKLKNKLGFLAYFLSFIKHIRRRPARFTITVDAEPSFTVRARGVLVANMGRITGGVEAVPRAHPQNGHLKIAVISPVDLLAWFRLILEAVLGSIEKSPHYELIKGRHIVINSKSGKQPYECDGSHFPATDVLTIDIFPGSLTVLYPSEAL